MCQLLPGCVILTRAVCTSSWNSEGSHSRRNDRVEQELQGCARSTAENWSRPWQQGILRLAEKCLLLLSGKSYLWQIQSCVYCFAVYLLIFFLRKALLLNFVGGSVKCLSHWLGMNWGTVQVWKQSSMSPRGWEQGVHSSLAFALPIGRG